MSRMDGSHREVLIGGTSLVFIAEQPRALAVNPTMRCPFENLFFDSWFMFEPLSKNINYDT